MIYTNSTTNYTNIDTQKSVHFAVSRTETRLKMHQTCIRNTGHICRALQALYTPQRCELMKTKTNNTNCSYRIFIVCRSPVSPVFWARVLLTIFCLSRVRVHKFRDNAVTGDIPLISPVLESMVPLVPDIGCPEHLEYTTFGSPTVYVLARLC